MKKIKIIMSLFLAVILLSGCSLEKVENKVSEDALKFKEDYESINGKVNASGKEHRTLSIDENNPFVFTTAEEIVKKIENKETFYVYFGDKQCPWCRSVIEKAIEVANNYKIDKIYYVNIWDDDHNEILRDTYKLNDDGEAEEVEEGTKAYYELLKHFDNVLRDYTLSDEDGEKKEVGEKRIYAPNFIYVKKGKAISMASGTSDLQEDSRGKLTKEILEDQELILSNFFSKESACDENC